MFRELQGIWIERDGELDGAIGTGSDHFYVKLIQVHPKQICHFPNHLLERRGRAVDAEPLVQTIDEGVELALDSSRPDDAERGIRKIRVLV